MRPGLDPSCSVAADLRRHHDSLARTFGDGGEKSVLLKKIEDARDKAYAEHADGCSQCAAHQRRCGACGADLGVGGHAFLCKDNPRRWRDAWTRLRGQPTAPLVPMRPLVYRTPTPVSLAARAAGPLVPPKPERPPAPRAPVRPRRSPFDILGLRPDASVEDARRRWKELALQYHPDVVASHAPEFRQVAEQKMQEINLAYDLVKAAGAHRRGP